ncbi:MAG: MBL fold metallo-hydrolase, partial [Gammaproteobacteria bacterium]|nr:MBL fold metallo-hydrolase [Gammaproteobacteria bacterium]
PGHLVLLWKGKYLFTGDHFAWISSLNQFGSFRDACWYSWEKQIESVKKMEAFQDVEWVFPGHGKWGKIDKKQFPEIIRESVQWMLSVR